LSDDSDCDKFDETLVKKSNYLAFTASYDSPHESNNYYSKNSESEDKQNELQRVYKQHVKRLNEFEIERSRLIEKVKCLEDELNES
jgi:predicted nuclease with TOPRIM domain